MTIKKIGHCCLIIKEAGLTIMTDPGMYSSAQNEATGIDVILITHEHQDHLHVESLQTVLTNNPQAKIYTNSGVGKILTDQSIPFELLEHGQTITIGEVEISGYGLEHAPIYPTIPQVVNTGYFIAKRLFYPGDALYHPETPVEILALPVAGPWLRLSEAIDYAKAVKPKNVFPVHDGMLMSGRLGPVHVLTETVLKQAQINFIALSEGQEGEF